MNPVIIKSAIFLLILLLPHIEVFSQSEECPAKLTLFHRSTGPLNKNVDKRTFKKYHRKDRHLATTDKTETHAINSDGNLIEVYRSKKKKGRAYLFSPEGVLLKKSAFSIKHAHGKGKFIARDVIKIGSKIFYITYKKDRKKKEFAVYAQEFDTEEFRLVSRPFLVTTIGFLGNWAREQLYLHPSPDGKLLFIGHNSGEKKNNIFKGMVVNWEFEAVNYFTIELGKKGWVALNEAYVSNEGHVVFQDYDKDETYAIWPDEEEVQKFDLNENDMRISGLTAQLHNGSLFVSGSLTGSKKYDGLDGIFLTNLSSDGDHDHLIYKKLSEEDVRDIMTEDELDMIREKKVEDKRKKKKKKKRKKKKKKKKKKKNKSLIPETRNGMVIRGLRKIGETYVMDAEVYYWYVVVTQTDKTTTTTYHYVYKDIFLFGFDAKSGDHLWSQRIEKYRHTINDQGQKGGYAVHQGDNSLDFIFIVRPESLGDKINMKECEPERDIYEPKDNRKNQERFILVRINEHGEKEYFNYGDVYKKLHNAVVLDPLMNNKEECRFYLPAYHYMKLNFEED